VACRNTGSPPPSPRWAPVPQLVGQTARAGVLPALELPQLLPVADIVVLAVPLTARTEGMVDRAFLSMLRDGALLVNVARGSVIVTDDLLA
jgi:phosphoglycerate dehydrogenase-like enzyme